MNVNYLSNYSLLVKYTFSKLNLESVTQTIPKIDTKKNLLKKKSFSLLVIKRLVKGRTTFQSCLNSVVNKCPVSYV